MLQKKVIASFIYSLFTTSTHKVNLVISG
uniref:Uncharacterized protein n=1 Tax=Rhizophora mucronata TaxID=61149 RepID=A0A2P2JQD2_RHIMU